MMNFLCLALGGRRELLRMAEARRSSDSLTALSGRPTILKAWRPGAESTSTSMSWASMPVMAAENSRTDTISGLLLYLSGTIDAQSSNRHGFESFGVDGLRAVLAFA